MYYKSLSITKLKAVYCYEGVHVHKTPDISIFKNSRNVNFRWGSIANNVNNCDGAKLLSSTWLFIFMIA